jgi:peptidoglycan/LPS O-acetylase OafA/YrhL
MCYSIYLLHNYIIATFGLVTENIGQHLPFEIRLVLQTLILGSITLVICTAFYKLIEQPCMSSDWPARLLVWFRNKWNRDMVSSSAQERDSENQLIQ